MARIPQTTILLILLTKVFPPWIDTWSDTMWIYKLHTFGRECQTFDVSTYGTFLASTGFCTKAVEWYNGSDWIDSTVTFQAYWIGMVSNYSDISVHDEKEILIAQRHFASENKTSARCIRDYSR